MQRDIEPDRGKINEMGLLIVNSFIYLSCIIPTYTNFRSLLVSSNQSDDVLLLVKMFKTWDFSEDLVE